MDNQTLNNRIKRIETKQTQLAQDQSANFSILSNINLQNIPIKKDTGFGSSDDLDDKSVELVKDKILKLPEFAKFKDKMAK